MQDVTVKSGVKREVTHADLADLLRNLLKTLDRHLALNNESEEVSVPCKVNGDSYRRSKPKKAVGKKKEVQVVALVFNSRPSARTCCYIGPSQPKPSTFQVSITELSTWLDCFTGLSFWRFVRWKTFYL